MTGSFHSKFLGIIGNILLHVGSTADELAGDFQQLADAEGAVTGGISPPPNGQKALPAPSNAQGSAAGTPQPGVGVAGNVKK